jgi:AICAR transformylase/IMP cyclohydrolase PurH
VLLTGALPDPAAGLTFKSSVAGGFLPDARQRSPHAKDLKVVTKRAPTPKELADLLFAFKRLQAREVERHRLRQGTAPRSASARGR